MLWSSLLRTDIWWCWRKAADPVTDIITEHAWEVLCIPSVVWNLSFHFFPLNPKLDIITMQHIGPNLQTHNTLHQDVYFIAGIYICIWPQATTDLRSILCRIMSSNGRLMWDGSGPAWPPLSPSMPDNRSTSTLQRGPLLKLQESRDGQCLVLFPRTGVKAACINFLFYTVSFLSV